MLVLITQFLLWPIVRVSEASWKRCWPPFLLCCVMVCPLWSREMNFPSYLTVTAWLLIQWNPTFIDVAINGSCFAPVLLVGSLLDNQEGTEIPSSLEVFLQSVNVFRVTQVSWSNYKAAVYLFQQCWTNSEGCLAVLLLTSINHHHKNLWEWFLSFNLEFLL